MFVFGKEGEDISPFSTPEAVPNLALCRDGKRRCFFRVKRARRFKISSAFFERKIVVYKLYDVNLLLNLLYLVHRAHIVAHESQCDACTCMLLFFVLMFIVLWLQKPILVRP